MQVDLLSDLAPSGLMKVKFVFKILEGNTETSREALH